MERVLKLITLDIRKKGFFKNLIISLFVVACILFLICAKGEVIAMPKMMLQIISYILLVIFSFSLTQEFSNKTDKMIFTGIFSRIEIMFSKLSSFIIAAIVCFIFYEILSIACNTFNSKMLLNNLCAFIVFAFTLGTFELLVSVFSSNFLLAGIIGYVLYFDLILALLNQALGPGRSEAVKHVIKSLPFYIANTGFYSGGYTVNQSIIMICCGVLFLVAACVVINRKDI
ncbi:ABC transporter permease [Clostridium sp. JS66]|uniref:ABC transporter permease n=1 Tax=Clostridium sp. JS66 TaxID=3064705 RepID=UPI00298DD4A7|nr:ABC transporter permease [Clostridium sp. JS66]WPC39384.1 ABC transporter permease [Clostridium sp. JS66]